jgi:hypothetical protein
MDCVHRLPRKPEIVSCLAGPQFRQCDSYLQFFRALSTMPNEPAPMPAAQGAPVISQKDYGIKYGLKGQALKRAHKQYLKTFQGASALELRDAQSSRAENPTYISKQDFGKRFKLNGQALRRAHEQYRKSFQVPGSTELPSRAKRRQDIGAAALLCLVWHYVRSFGRPPATSTALLPGAMRGSRQSAVAAAGTTQPRR